MLFQSSGDATQHQHAGSLVRLLHLHHLKAPRQRRVAFKILLVFRPSSSGDGAQFAARQSGLEQISGVILSRGSTRADHGVCFIHKQNHRRGRRLGFFNQCLQPILKLALDSRARLQQRKIERQNLHIAQRRWNIALSHPSREAFHDGRLADSCLSCENRIVLAPPHQNVDHLANLRIAAQHRIHLALPALLGEIYREPLQIRSQSRQQLHGFGGKQRRLVFSCPAGQRCEISHQSIGRQSIQFQADVPCNAPQVFLDQQRQNEVTAAHQWLPEIERAERPGICKSPDQRRAEGRSPRIPGLQLF